MARCTVVHRTDSLAGRVDSPVPLSSLFWLSLAMRRQLCTQCCRRPSRSAAAKPITAAACSTSPLPATTSPARRRTGERTPHETWSSFAASASWRPCAGRETLWMRSRRPERRDCGECRWQCRAVLGSRCPSRSLKSVLFSGCTQITSFLHSATTCFHR